jgi:Domain of unknown function (DUF5668)/B-box zinc finger
MNCQNHPETPATAYCRTCGMPVCDACRRDAFGTVYCAEHAPAPSFTASQTATPPPPMSDAGYAPPPPGYVPPPPGYAPPPPEPPPVGFVAGNRAYPIPPRPGAVSPALAFFLGLIPGVGAIYNGQYAKGIVHGLIWGLLMSIADSRAAHGLEAIFVMLVIVWWAYMAIEAHRTAQLIAAGQSVDEFSSIVSLNGRGDQAVAAGVILVVLGIILLLRTLNVLDIDELMARYWPVLLIAGGAWLLWGRISGHSDASARHAEARHER